MPQASQMYRYAAFMLINYRRYTKVVHLNAMWMIQRFTRVMANINNDLSRIQYSVGVSIIRTAERVR